MPHPSLTVITQRPVFEDEKDRNSTQGGVNKIL